MDDERLEKITSALSDASTFSEEDAQLHEAWLGMAQHLSSAPIPWTLDPDDVLSEVVRRERRQRRSISLRGAAVAAALLLMVAAVVGVSWDPGAARNDRASEARTDPKIVDVVAWEDGWDSSATEVEAELVACADLFQPPVSDAWIDRRIQALFAECIWVWQWL